MIINSITLQNFKSYEEETTLNLKPQNGKNIILIGGENGAGKSTLFQAIKLCIYGATAYGYVGQNHYYTELVKSYINNNAFSHDKIDTFIELNLSFDPANPNNCYTLRRAWTYTNERLNEQFSVYHNDTLLEDEELDYFDQFLKSTLPPSLFNFFFFDGEELGNFFTDKSSKQSMRESILELFNFNTFDLLEKQLKSYQRVQSKNDKELKIVQEEYESLSQSLSNLKDTKHNLEQDIENWIIELDNLDAKKQKLDQDFRQSGGLLEEEQTHLNALITKLENERTEINLNIRTFCNNKLPFLLVSKHIEKLIEQIQKEQQLSEYELFKAKLEPSIINKSVNSLHSVNINDQDAKQITEYILSNLYDENELQHIVEILGLSKEQAHSILALCTKMQSQKTAYTKVVEQSYSRLDEISMELKATKSKLHSSVNNEQLFEYMNQINEINEQISTFKAKINVSDDQLAELDNKISTTTLAYTKAKNKTIELLQDSNISNLSMDLINYFDELLKTVTSKKIKLIEVEFLNIFKKIIRKDNFIDDIQLDEDFNSTLYIYKEYSATELINICQNLGVKNLSYKYGPLFVEDLYSLFDANEDTIVDHLWRHSLQDSFKLHTKINVALLSSGEKQVYVLCLIWAILKVSDVDIPFIIDTPYARIDTTHRNALTTLYLPKISNQVIILSTNEEIDQELYKTIEPFIANEHLLIYDSATRKTTTKNTYFEV